MYLLTFCLVRYFFGCLIACLFDFFSCLFECLAASLLAFVLLVSFVPRMKQYLCSLQDGLTGSAWGDWANYTASPLRAFENELGVQAPVGFWDPAGFTADGSTENFARRRQTELKHGRISMLATWSRFGNILHLWLLLKRWHASMLTFIS